MSLYTSVYNTQDTIVHIVEQRVVVLARESQERAAGADRWHVPIYSPLRLHQLAYLLQSHQFNSQDRNTRLNIPKFQSKFSTELI